MKKVLTGTAKGLLIYHFEEGNKPYLADKHFLGFNISMVYVNPFTGRWWVSISHKHWGQKLHYSDDKGATWEEVKLPSFGQRKKQDGEVARLKQVWTMVCGGAEGPHELWLGTEPGGLFFSDDDGKSFHLMDSLWNHPSRGKWFGAGRDEPFIHSIIVNPDDNNQIFVAVSCAGIFKSNDKGNTWRPVNKGLEAIYLPNPHVDVGHDPHRVLMHQVNHEVLWQQSHCGIYYTDNGAETWKRVSVSGKIPDYGFCVAIDEGDPARAWVIPAESDEMRIAPGLRLQVWQTTNFGKSWTSVSKGLPEKDAFDIVLRHSFAKSGNLFVFGTNNGNIYYSQGDRIYWELLTSNVTKVNTVEIFEDNRTVK